MSGVALFAAAMTIWGCGSNGAAPPPSTGSGGSSNPTGSGGSVGSGGSSMGSGGTGGGTPQGSGGSGGASGGSLGSDGGAGTGGAAGSGGDAAAGVSGQDGGPGPSALWAGLRNPIYAHDGWSVKDVAMVLVGDTYRFYFSAFFADAGMERCHVATTSSTDLKTFAAATVLFDGKADGWLGMCSPDVQLIGAQYVMTFNSWGDLAGKPNQLFYATSPNLGTWSAARPLGAALTGGKRAIDAAIGNDNGRLFLFWKERVGADRTRLAVATALDGSWRFVGDGLPALPATGGRDNGLTHENFQFLRIDGKWQLLSTDYEPHAPWLYTMAGAGTDENDWLSWQNGVRVQVAGEGFNSDHQANAAFLVDWRARDGYFYLVYAGRTEGTSHAGRGDNKLGLSRSKDLKSWSAAGK
ncbi:MAG TPA: family 43 glycosylhydrolase [Polyangia bacterium]|nr:family 43 glycosylhydrolase [Polyangia bacterium]